MSLICVTKSQCQVKIDDGIVSVSNFYRVAEQNKGARATRPWRPMRVRRVLAKLGKFGIVNGPRKAAAGI
jgi:hypothetical protein